MYIREERIRQSMTQKRLAFEAGVDARTVRKVEKGEAVSPETTRAVMQALGLPLPGPSTAALKPSTTAAMSTWAYLFVGALGALYLLTLYLNAVAPDAADYAPLTGLIVLCSGVTLWDLSGRGPGQGRFAGVVLFCIGVDAAFFYWDRGWPGTPFVFAAVTMMTAVMIGIPRIRARLVVSKGGVYDLHRLLVAITTSWVFLWLMLGRHEMWRIAVIIRYLWEEPEGPGAALLAAFFSPILIAMALAFLLFGKTRTAGYVVMAATCSLWATFNVQYQIVMSFSVWLETGHIHNWMYTLCTNMPQIVMAAIGFYQLRGRIRDGLSFVSRAVSCPEPLRER